MHWDAITYISNDGARPLTGVEFAEKLAIVKERLAIAVTMPAAEARHFAWNDPAYWDNINSIRTLYYRYPAIVVGAVAKQLGQLVPAFPQHRLFAFQMAIVILATMAFGLFVLSTKAERTISLTELLLVTVIASSPPFLSAFRQMLSESLAILLLLPFLILMRKGLASNSHAQGCLLAAIGGAVLFGILRVRYDVGVLAALSLLPLGLAAAVPTWKAAAGRAAICAAAFVGIFVVDGVTNGWGLLPWHYQATAFADMTVSRYQGDQLFFEEALLVNIALIVILGLLSAKLRGWRMIVGHLAPFAFLAFMMFRMHEAQAQWEARHLFPLFMGMIAVLLAAGAPLSTGKSGVAIGLALIAFNIVSALYFQPLTKSSYCYYCIAHNNRGSEEAAIPLAMYQMWTDKKTIMLSDQLSEEAWRMAGFGREPVFVSDDVRKADIVPISLLFSGGQGLRWVAAKEICAAAGSKGAMIRMVDGQATLTRGCDLPRQ